MVLLDAHPLVAVVPQPAGASRCCMYSRVTKDDFVPTRSLSPREGISIYSFVKTICSVEPLVSPQFMLAIRHPLSTRESRRPVIFLP